MALGETYVGSLDILSHLKLREEALHARPDFVVRWHIGVYLVHVFSQFRGRVPTGWEATHEGNALVTVRCRLQDKQVFLDCCTHDP